MAAPRVLLGHLWDADVVQVWDCFYAFRIPPPCVCPDQWVQTKIPCRFLPTRYLWRTVRKTRPAEISKLAKKAKKGYTYPNGADLIRCVGGLFTCAGTGERQLPCTAVIFVFLPILYYRTNVLSIIIVKGNAGILLKTEKFITFLRI